MNKYFIIFLNIILFFSFNAVYGAGIALIFLALLNIIFLWLWGYTPHELKGIEKFNQTIIDSYNNGRGRYFYLANRDVVLYIPSDDVMILVERDATPEYFQYLVENGINASKGLVGVNVVRNLEEHGLKYNVFNVGYRYYNFKGW